MSDYQPERIWRDPRTGACYLKPEEGDIEYVRAPAASATPGAYAISPEWAERMLPADEGVVPSAGAPTAPATPARDDLRDALSDLLDQMKGYNLVNSRAYAKGCAVLRDAGGTPDRDDLRAENRRLKARLWSIGHAAGIETKQDLMEDALAALRDAGGTDGAPGDAQGRA